MSRPEFVYETYIKAPAEKVWEALTTAEFTSQYFYATHVESTWQPGAAVTYWYEPGGTAAVEGVVLEAEAPNKLVVTWHVLYDEDAKKEAPSQVSFLIEDLDGQSRLRVVHDQFPEHSVVVSGIENGWPWIIAGLKSLLETGEPLPDMS